MGVCWGSFYAGERCLPRLGGLPRGVSTQGCLPGGVYCIGQASYWNAKL